MGEIEDARPGAADGIDCVGDGDDEGGGGGDDDEGANAIDKEEPVGARSSSNVVAVPGTQVVAVKERLGPEARQRKEDVTLFRQYLAKCLK